MAAEPPNVKAIPFPGTSIRVRTSLNQDLPCLIAFRLFLLSQASNTQNARDLDLFD